MANSRTKSFIKLRALLFFCCAMALSLTIAVNIILALYKDKITQTLNSHFFKLVSVENIFYLPPNFIILKGLCISESKIKTNQKIFDIPISCASFSLASLFLNRSFYIPSLYCAGLTADLSGLLSFTKENFTQILDFITHLPRRDFRLTARQITIKPAGKNIYPVDTKGDFDLKIHGAAVSVSGCVGKDSFSLQGSLAQERINVDNFKLVSKDINGQLWGKLSPSLVEFKGFMFINNLNLAGKPGLGNILILDIDSRIKIAFGRVGIERLNFLINNNPVRLTADILLSKPFNCNLKLFSNFRNLDNKKDGRLKNITLIASTVSREDKTITLNGSLNIDSLEQKKESLPLEKIKLNVRDTVLSFKESSVLKIAAAQVNLFSQTSTNTYNINLENFRAEVYQPGKTGQLIKFSSGFYNGILRGRGQIEMRRFIPVISAVIRVKDVSAEKLEGILIHFSKLYGKLSSQMFFVNYPQLVFRGTMRLHDGSLNNFEFLKWLANLFGLPSLKKIQFNTASADFIADKEGVGMYDMGLDSTNVKIKGYFKLKEGDMVSSRIFLSLRRGLLRESPRFTPLLRLLDTKQELIKFNFQLSGNLHGMNFQWLKSDFKDGLQRAIPNFAKRAFEEKVEKIIESILKE